MTSSLVATGVDMGEAVGGIFLKPAQEYRRGRSRSKKPESRQSSPSKITRTSRTSSTTGEGMSLIDRPDANHETLLQNGPRPMAVAGSMALASGKSLGMMVPIFYKAALVDWPLAATEGFRGMPRLWGEEVKDYGKVTDWKSGATVAGKTFALGIGDGFKDLVQLPGEGARKEGTWGAIKGVAKGSGSLLTKTVTGSLGLIAYPGQGITKSIWTLAHGETGKKIMAARRIEGIWRARHAGGTVIEVVEKEYYNLNLRQ